MKVLENVLAKFGDGLYVADHSINLDRDVRTEWTADRTRCDVVADKVRFGCDCGHGFDVDLRAATPAVKMRVWLADDGSDTRLTFVHATHPAPPCPHWTHIEAQ